VDLVALGHFGRSGRHHLLRLLKFAERVVRLLEWTVLVLLWGTVVVLLWGTVVVLFWSAVVLLLLLVRRVGVISLEGFEQFEFCLPILML
jgi:hypothetical protein